MQERQRKSVTNKNHLSQIFGGEPCLDWNSWCCWWLKFQNERGQPFRPTDFILLLASAMQMLLACNVFSWTWLIHVNAYVVASWEGGTAPQRKYLVEWNEALIGRYNAKKYKALNQVLLSSHSLQHIWGRRGKGCPTLNQNYQKEALWKYQWAYIHDWSGKEEAILWDVSLEGSKGQDMKLTIKQSKQGGFVIFVICTCAGAVLMFISESLRIFRNHVPKN